MTVDEINEEVSSAYEELLKLLYKQLSDAYSDYTAFEDMLYVIRATEYVVDTCSDVDKELKNKVKDFIDKCKKAIKFSKKYYISSFGEWNLKTTALLLKSIGDDNYKSKCEDAGVLSKENDALYEEYEKIYLETIKAYVDSEEYLEKLEKLKAIKKKIDKNTKSIASK